MNLLGRALAISILLPSIIAAAGCGGDDNASTTDGSAGGTSVTDGGSSEATRAEAATSDAADNCSADAAAIDKIVCEADAFLATLPSTQLAAVNLAPSVTTERTEWSNLPGVTRAGTQMGSLSATSQAAALALMDAVLSTAGVADLTGVRAADDYLGSLSGTTGAGDGGGMGPGGGMGGTTGGSTYSSNNYSIAIIGTPSSTGNWELMFGGHHMAYNIIYVNGVGYPIPNHLGVEPKASFTINGQSYQPMLDEGTAIRAIFLSLSTADLGTAYLTGQTFTDVLIGPVEYGTGSSAAAKAKYPTGTNRTGVLVSSLAAAQQALVTTAISAWVGDYESTISTPLLAAYTTADAYADTYVAWAGTQADGVDPDVSGTYMRIDGPRVWIEVACQSGVVITGLTHYHSIYRDKQFDYGGTL